MNVGDDVQKVSGYKFYGTIVAVFETILGETRYVVEATGDGYEGMLHIYNGNQLKLA